MKHNLYGLGEVALKNDEVYFVPSDCNILFCLSLNRWEVHVVDKMPWDNLGIVDCYIDNRGGVWCVSMCNLKIAYWDGSEHIIEYSSEHERSSFISFYDGDLIWFFSRNISDPIIAFNTIEKKYEIKNALNEIEGENIIAGVTKVNNGIVFSLREKNSYIETCPPFDTYKINKTNIPGEIKSIAYSNDGIYLSIYSEGSIRIVEILDKKMRDIAIPEFDAANYLRLIYNEHLFFCICDELYMVENGKISAKMKVNSRLKKGSLFIHTIIYKNYIVLLPNNAEAIGIYDMEKRELGKVDFFVEPKERFKIESVCYEKDIGLDSLLSFITDNI